MVIASSHMLAFSFWWKVPKGYMALEQIFVSARTIKRHHHHTLSALVSLSAWVSDQSSWDGNPLVDVRTGDRHADDDDAFYCSCRNNKFRAARWAVEQTWFEEDKLRLWPRWFYSKLNRNKPNKTDWKIYLHGKYISPARVEFASRGYASLLLI